MNIEKIIETLKEFKNNAYGIQGVVLFGKDVMMLTDPPIGDWNKECAKSIAGVMEVLTERICRQLEWEPAQDICVKSEDGYIIRVSFSSDLFLLVKASNSTNQGLLEFDVAQMKDEIQTYLKAKSSSGETTQISTKINGDNKKPQGRW